MWKHVSTGLVVLSLCAPAAAQRMGSTNRAAPTVTESIEFKDGPKLEVSYQSITWAGGQMMRRLMDKEGGAGAREGFNRRAVGSPLGTVAASAGFTLGGKAVDAGEYDLYFTIDEDLKWHLVLASKTTDGPPIDWALPLEDTDNHRSRLGIDLGAGDEDNTGVLRISFGTKHCAVAFAPGEGE